MLMALIYAQTDNPGGVILILIVVALVLLYKYGGVGWAPRSDSHGTASFAGIKDLEKAGLLGDKGLILGRTLEEGKLIRLKDVCHLLLIGGTGSGKGVSAVLPQLLTYRKGSCVVFDTKGDLAQIAGKARREKLGQRVLVLGPFTGGKDTLNPLDCIEDGPVLVDKCRALAEALVIRTGAEPDPHWNESAVMVITAVITFVCLKCPEGERNLNTVREITSDPTLLDSCAQMLRGMGGVPARLGNQLAGLKDKERAGVLSTVGRHLAFIDSELVGRSLQASTFRVEELCSPGTTLFLQIPQDQLQAQRGLLRLWVSTLVRAVAQHGCNGGECLFMLDEASALGSLPALKECLERGRSGGSRLFLAYQSDAQVKAAFEKEPTLIYDNCATQVYLMPPSGLETAERISNMLGEYTQVVEGRNAGTSRSAQDGTRSFEQGTTHGRNEGVNLSVQARKLLDPSECLRADRMWLICFHSAIRRPILARRVLYYRDSLFRSVLAPNRPKGRLLWAAILTAMGLLALAWHLFGGV